MEKPLYIKLTEQLIQEIDSNLNVGDLLQSERKLTETYDVSRTTVRLALKELEKKGYITTVHGKGSFVANKQETLVDLNQQYSFTEDMRKIGRTPNTKVLDLSIIQDSERLYEIFQKRTTSFVKLVRLRSADGFPLMYEETYLPYHKFNEITVERLNQLPLYDIFTEDYNETVKLAKEEFSAGIASKKEAQHLEIKKNSPVLQIFRTTLNLNNEVIEYTESKARPDKFSYRTVHYNYST